MHNIHNTYSYNYFFNGQVQIILLKQCCFSNLFFVLTGKILMFYLAVLIKLDKYNSTN